MIITSPLEQFEITYIAKICFININTVTLYMVLIGSIYMMYIGIIHGNRTNITATISWRNVLKFVNGVIHKNLGNAGEPFMIFLVNIFSSVLLANLIGMIPYAFTVTSHLIITITISMVAFPGMNMIGLEKHKGRFFELSLPKGSPIQMSFFPVLIEAISHVARVFSLAIRPFANMMSGHSLLKILSNFVHVLALKTNLFFLAIVPFIIVFPIVGLEIGIAILQAYVYLILVVIYLHDSLYLH